MLTAKRALALAALICTVILLYKTSHAPGAAPLPGIKNVHSPRPTGTYNDNKNIRMGSKSSKKSDDEATKKAPVGAASRLVQTEVIDHGLRPQIPMQDFRSRPLRSQLAYLFPYDEAGKFPAYIWQTWKSAPEDSSFPANFRPLAQSWTDKHPGFIHEVITDDVAMHLISHLYSSVPEVVDAYKSLPLAVLKADFFRYLILLARGGIYTDIDTAALQSVVDWVPSDVDRASYGLVIGIEADPDRPDWADWYSRRIQFCQWTIQAKMGHPTLRSTVVAITEETLRRKKAGQLKHPADLQKDIIEFTGPALWTDQVFNYLNDPEYFDMTSTPSNVTWKQFTGITTARKIGDVVVLPITSFSPGIRTMGAEEDDHPMAFVKHMFDGSWKPDSERHIGEEKQ